MRGRRREESAWCQELVGAARWTLPSRRSQMRRSRAAAARSGLPSRLLWLRRSLVLCIWRPAGGFVRWCCSRGILCC